MPSSPCLHTSTPPHIPRSTRSTQTHLPRSTRSTQTHSHHHHQQPSAINLINPDPHTQINLDQPDQTIPRSTHNPNQPRSSKPTQTKTNPHHKLRLNHHRGLPTSLPSIINSNPHRHHRDHATRHVVTHSTDLATLVACFERERERCERGREN